MRDERLTAGSLPMGTKRADVDPAIARSLHVLASMLGDMVEIVVEAEAMATKGEHKAATALLAQIEPRLHDALLLQRGILVLHRER